MKQVNLKQGSEEWLQHRRTHFNASDASAMLGLSKLTKRNELLRIMQTGNGKEFSDYVQKMVLDKGHDVEEKARPIAEQMIDEPLFPITGVNGVLSASFDGLTILFDIVFEHKQWNEELAGQVKNNIVPDTHMPQLQQQQLLVSGADFCLFVVSNGTKEKLENTKVYPCKEWFKRINDGWKQFEKDLSDYEHVEHKEKPLPAVVQELPHLVLKIKGGVDQTNLPKVQETILHFISSINTNLDTDEDFANAENIVKFCGEAEKQLEETKKNALSETQSIDEAMKTIDYLKLELRSKRLMLDKLVKTRKAQIKDALALNAKAELNDLIAKINNEVTPLCIEINSIDVNTPLKNKRTMASLHNAMATYIAEVKIQINNQATIVSTNLRTFNEMKNGYEFLFADIVQNSQLEQSIFKSVMQSKINDYKQQEANRLEQERKIIAEQERVKAEKTAQAKLDAERLANRLEQERLNNQRLAQERAAQEQLEEARLAEQLKNKSVKTEAVNVALTFDAIKTFFKGLEVIHEDLGHLLLSSNVHGQQKAIVNIKLAILTIEKEEKK